MGTVNKVKEAGGTHDDNEDTSDREKAWRRCLSRGGCVMMQNASAAEEETLSLPDKMSGGRSASCKATRE